MLVSLSLHAGRILSNDVRKERLDMRNVKKLLATVLVGAAGVSCSGGGGGGGSDKADKDVIVGVVSGPVSEGGDQATFSVVLRAKPKDDVVIPVSSLDEEEGTVSPTSLTFTEENWDAPQEVLVTGVDDSDRDGNVTFPVALGAVESEDGGYEGLDPEDVTVTNLDDESAGVRFTEVVGQTTEEGAAASFDVYLQSRPTADVLLIFGTSDLGEGTTDIQQVVFTPQDWNAPQTVTVTGVDDEEADGAQNYSVLFQTAFSDDPDYAFLPVDSIALTNLDDDTAGIFVSRTSGATSERRDEVAFTVRLLSRPSASVSLTWTLSDDEEAEYTTTSSDDLTTQFTVNNWNVPQEIRLAGLNDSVADGDQPYTVSVTSVTTQDATYAAIARPMVHLVNVDDDIAGYILGAPSGPTTETGESSKFTVALRAAGSADVTVDLSVSNPGEATVSPSTLTLSTTPKTVTVQGRMDFRRDGHQRYEIVFSPAVSTDEAYSGMQLPNVGLTNIDDGPVKNALVLDDANGSEADDAANEAGYTVLESSDFAGFDSTFDSEELELIILELTTSMMPVSSETRLLGWISSGGGLILSHWDLASHPALEAALDIDAAAFTSNNRLFLPATDAEPNLFDSSYSFPAPLIGDVLAGDIANELMVTTTNSSIAARFEDADTGPGAIVLARGGQVVVNGFSPDDIGPVDNEPIGFPAGDGIPDLRELYSNELAVLRAAGGDGPATRFDNDTSQEILDSPTVDSMIEVAGAAIPTAVRVSLYITHEYDGDLDIFLEGPDGTSVELSTDNGPGDQDFGTACSPDSARTTFDDGASTAIVDGTAPYVGSFQPEGTLSSFAGLPANGQWTLHVDDDGAGDVGTLHCWSLHFDY